MLLSRHLSEEIPRWSGGPAKEADGGCRLSPDGKLRRPTEGKVRGCAEGGVFLTSCTFTGKEQLLMPGKKEREGICVFFFREEVDPLCFLRDRPWTSLGHQATCMSIHMHVLYIGRYIHIYVYRDGCMTNVGELGGEEEQRRAFFHVVGRCADVARCMQRREREMGLLAGQVELLALAAC